MFLLVGGATMLDNDDDDDDSLLFVVVVFDGMFRSSPFSLLMLCCVSSSLISAVRCLCSCFTIVPLANYNNNGTSFITFWLSTAELLLLSPRHAIRSHQRQAASVIVGRISVDEQTIDMDVQWKSKRACQKANQTQTSVEMALLD